MQNELSISTALIPRGSTVLCAVSGGADSVCLLSLCRERGDLRVLCAHLDHGIRGEESRRDAAFTGELCRAWDIPFFTERVSVPELARFWGMGIEEAARKARYAFLERIAAEQGADRIATAHTMNDNAETVLLRLARGTGLCGLCGIPEQRGIIVRPLLHHSREQVEAYLRERAIPWVEDSTNQSDDYARNRARHTVLPAMEELHGGALGAIHRMTALVREDEDCLEQMADALLRAWGDKLPAEELRNQHPAVARRVLRRWTGWELTREHTETLLALCAGKGASSAAEMPGGRIVREYGYLKIAEKTPEPLRERELRPGESFYLNASGLSVRCREETAGEVQKSFTTFLFPYDKICGKLILTSRREGDTIRLWGREGTRILKKLMIEEKIPRSERALLPVIRDERGVLAVYSIGQSAGSVPAPGERCVRIDFDKNAEDRRE